MRVVGVRALLAVGVMAVVTAGWMMAASAANGVELELSLSTDGTCAPIGQDTLFINADTEVTICHHMINNTGGELSLHVLKNLVAGVLLDNDPTEIDHGDTRTEQVTLELAAGTVLEAVWSSFDQGGQEFEAVGTASVLACSTLYVDQSASAGGDGLSWGSAFTDLQDALEQPNVCPTTEIRVAEGTYLPDRGTGDTTRSFILTDGVTVRGGYRSGGAPAPDGSTTTLSGDLLGNDNTNIDRDEPTRSDNAITVVQLETASTAVITGVTISDGNSTTSDAFIAPIATGLISSGELVLVDVIIEDNASKVGVVSTRTGLQLISSIVRNNDSSASSIVTQHTQMAPTTIVSTLIENNASWSSAVFMNKGSIVNSAVSGSTFSWSGNAIDVSSGDGVQLTNVTVADNRSSGPTGRGIRARSGAVVNIANSIVWDNSTGGVFTEVGGTTTITNSITQSAQPGTGNMVADPLFTNPAAGDYTLRLGSPAIDAGDNTMLPADAFDLDDDGNTTEQLPLDISGRARFGDGTVDMGAHEYSPDGLTILAEPAVCFDSQAPGAGGTFSGQEVRTVEVTGAGECVPAGASAVVFTVSAIKPLTEGNLLLTPAGVTATGSAGVVNYGAENGLNNANTVTIPLSAGGAVDIAANTGPAGAVPTTDVRLVAVGYYSPNVDADLNFFPVNPCAVADSRTTQGASDAFDGPNDDGLWPVGSGFPDVDVVGTFAAGQGGGNTDCGVPASADAVMVNVVAVNMEGGSGHLSVGAGGTDPANEARTPFAVLSPKMNNGASTLVQLGPSGTVALDIDGDGGASTMVRVEVLGYYNKDSSGLDFQDVTPCAVFDTRLNQGAAGAFLGERQHGPTHTTTYQIAGDTVPVGQGGVVDNGGGVGSCEVPEDAEAVLINLEAVNALQEGNFWVSAAGTTTTGGVLNFNNVVPKMNNANAVVVPLNGAGQLDLEINAGNFTPVGTNIAHARGVILGYYN